MIDQKLEMKIRYGAAGLVAFILVATIIKVYLGLILYYGFVGLSLIMGFLMAYKWFVGKPIKKNEENP